MLVRLSGNIRKTNIYISQCNNDAICTWQKILKSKFALSHLFVHLLSFVCLWSVQFKHSSRFYRVITTSNKVLANMKLPINSQLVILLIFFMFTSFCQMLPCSLNPHFYEESSEYDGKKLIVSCQFFTRMSPLRRKKLFIKISSSKKQIPFINFAKEKTWMDKIDG